MQHWCHILKIPQISKESWNKMSHIPSLLLLEPIHNCHLNYVKEFEKCPSCISLKLSESCRKCVRIPNVISFWKIIKKYWVASETDFILSYLSHCWLVCTLILGICILLNLKCHSIFVFFSTILSEEGSTS